MGLLRSRTDAWIFSHGEGWCKSGVYGVRLSDIIISELLLYYDRYRILLLLFSSLYWIVVYKLNIVPFLI